MDANSNGPSWSYPVWMCLWTGLSFWNFIKQYPHDNFHIIITDHKCLAPACLPVFYTTFNLWQWHSSNRATSTAVSWEHCFSHFSACRIVPCATVWSIQTFCFLTLLDVMVFHMLLSVLYGGPLEFLLVIIYCADPVSQMNTHCKKKLFFYFLCWETSQNCHFHRFLSELGTLGETGTAMVLH